MLNDGSVSEGVRSFRRAVLISLLFFTAAFGAVFAVLNFLRDNTAAMLAEIVMGALALILVSIVSRTRALLAWSALYLTLFNGVMMYILTLPASSPTVFAWVLLIPILSHMLLGRILGGAATLFFLGTAFAIYLGRFGLDPVLGSPIAILNVAGVAICIFGFSFVYETARNRSEMALARQARVDPLTGLGNRLLFAERFAAERARYQRHGVPFSLLIIDIDRFKSINDRFGHEIGDRVLVWVANLLRDHTRQSDCVFRMGGEEFGILLPGADGAAASSAAEALRARIEAGRLETEGEVLSVTASLGVAQATAECHTQEGMIDRADRRLYEAKLAGRNRIVGCSGASPIDRSLEAVEHTEPGHPAAAQSGPIIPPPCPAGETARR